MYNYVAFSILCQEKVSLSLMDYYVVRSQHDIPNRTGFYVKRSSKVSDILYKDPKSSDTDISIISPLWLARLTAQG